MSDAHSTPVDVHRVQPALESLSAVVQVPEFKQRLRKRGEELAP